ncbi:MAG TPA: hypothetical protein VHK67_02815 [Rhabdochlamydiaceae bacterium]|jgi:hypothetical protein|nr:hypothetical protein [Rhabdochlamydiaceae bacterium]
MSMLAKLDQSISVAKGQCRDFFLNTDGSVVSNNSLLASWVEAIPLARSMYDQTPNIIEVFMKCVEHWAALKNDQKFNRRAVSVEEFTQQIERICLVRDFALLYLDKIEANPTQKEKISGLLTELLGKPTGALSPTLIAITPEAFKEQLDLATVWAMEERCPPPLTEAILAMPAPKTDFLDPSHSIPNILELSAHFQTVVQRIENPGGNWMAYVTNFWYGAHAEDKKALDMMCKAVVEAKDPKYRLVYGSTRLYLGKLLALFRTGKISDLEVHNCFKELIIASKVCLSDWATVAENQYLALTGKNVTAKDKVLNWKSEFVAEHLKQFFPLVYSDLEDTQNVHLMNTLIHHYGKQLGMSHLKAASVDLHIAKNVEALPYKLSDVFCYLTEKWNRLSVESLKIHSHMHKWQDTIGTFLTERVKQAIPAVKDPQGFVLTEYFDGTGMLNDRGAIRFLKETLTSIPQTQKA